MKKTLPLIIEEYYRETSWCSQILSALSIEAAKREVLLREIRMDEMDFPQDTPVVLLGASLENLPAAGRLIIAGVEPRQLSSHISFVTLDRRTAMRQLVHYLYRCGARRIALVGTDATVHTDLLRFQGWADAVQELGIGDGIRDAFHANENPDQCYTAFMENVQDYDAAACTNDYIALQLLQMLRERKIAVPDQLMVTGFGDFQMAQWAYPALTSVSINLQEIGRQAFFAWQYLEKNPMVRSLNLSVDCSIHVRKSTPPCASIPSLPGAVSAFPPPLPHRTFMTATMRQLARMENLISGADETTLRLLKGVARKIPNERLCEDVYLSYTAFKRRMNKIYGACGVQSKQELADLLNTFIPEFARAP